MMVWDRKKRNRSLTRLLVVFLLMIPFLIGFSQPLVFTFSDLNLEERILLLGDRSQFDFFLPVGYPTEGFTSTVTLFYRASALAGPRASVTLLINDIPVDTRFLQGAPQPQVFPFSGDYLEERAFAKLSFLVDLDQVGCRVGETASSPDLRTLFFSIEKESFFEIAHGEPDLDSIWREPSITGFFDPFGIVQDFHFAVEPGSLAHMRSMANVAYALGFGSKGFARKLSLSSRASTDAKNISFQEGNRIVSGVSSLSLGTDLTPEMLGEHLFDILPLSQVSISKADFKAPPASADDKHRIPFSDLMNVASGLTIGFSGSQKSFIPLSTIGGVPVDARLVLKMRTTPLAHPESIAGNLRLNGHLLQSFSFHSTSQDVELSIPIPPRLFRGINELEIQWINQTLCREATLGFDEHSFLEFSVLQPLPAPKMGDLGHLFSGSKIVVITQPSLETARILMEYAFYLGRNGTPDRSFFVVSPEQIKNRMDTIQTYDGVILILDPVEMAFFEPLVDASKSFKIMDRSRGITMLEFDSREPLGVIGVYSLKERPAVMFTWYGSSTGFSWIQSDRFDRMIREGGNLLLIGSRGMASAAIEKETSWIVVSMEEEHSVWDAWRIWIIIAIGLLGILLIIVAYLRSSGKRKKSGG